MQKFFGPDSKLYAFCVRVTGLIVLSCAFLLCSLPIVTFVPSAEALYYAGVKYIRYERGRPWQEFKSVFLKNIRRDLVPGILCTGLFTGTVFGLKFLLKADLIQNKALLFLTVVLLLYVMLLFIVMLWYVFIGSVSSGPVREILKAAFVLSLRNIGKSLVFVLIVLISGVFIFILPPLLLLLPALSFLGISKFINPVIYKYYPSAFDYRTEIQENQ